MTSLTFTGFVTLGVTDDGRVFELQPPELTRALIDGALRRDMDQTRLGIEVYTLQIEPVRLISESEVNNGF
jgi:hypothetical protein